MSVLDGIAASFADLISCASLSAIMDSNTYAVEAEIEAKHWWFVGRRELFARLLKESGLAQDCDALDIGTSTGTNLRMLKELGFRYITGLDASPEAARYCQEKGLGKVELGDVCALPFADQSFDLVLATDVIEHVDNDLAALREIRRVLRQGGRALITVPAFSCLWGPQDDVAHHKRRYLRGQLLDTIRLANLQMRRSFYFNYILFAPIWLARRVLRVTKPDLHSENEINTPVLNWALTWIFSLDVRTAEWLSPPFGVSALALVERVD